jgi:dipeptidyl aminopeptidase/acylaminoacyl peptidase
MHVLATTIFAASLCLTEVQEHPGGTVLPHEKYIHVVSEADSPIQQLYIKSRDGLYVAAALRKPRGEGPFPALVHFHGAPGGSGMEPLMSWVRGDTGSPVWERFLQEGLVVVAADYRALVNRSLAEPTPATQVSYVDDGLAVVEHVRKLPFVDPNRITVYGVSLGATSRCT